MIKMKISEFIEKLNQFKDKNGDLIVSDSLGYAINDIHIANLYGFGGICIIQYTAEEDE